VTIAEDGANFTEAKKILDYLFKMFNIKYELKEVENEKLISGRAGKIIVNEKEIGIIGEVHPQILKNWKINLPVSLFEIDLEGF
jgi:phenylalanyl-tRNA synthetase beta chain